MRLRRRWIVNVAHRPRPELCYSCDEVLHFVFWSSANRARKRRVRRDGDAVRVHVRRATP